MESIESKKAAYLHHFYHLKKSDEKHRKLIIYKKFFKCKDNLIKILIIC